MELNTKEELISIIKKQEELINKQSSRLDLLEKHLDTKDEDKEKETEEEKAEETNEEVTEEEVDEVSKLLGV